MSEADYDHVRKEQIAASYFEYLRDHLGAFDAKKETIIIVPGITGTKLRISVSPFDQIGSGFERSDYRDLWSVNAQTYRESYKLALGPSGHDFENHIVLQDGTIDGELVGIVSVAPYTGAISFFRAQGKNCLFFGYDWRRSLSESAQTLGFFVDEVHRLTNQQEDRITLVGHSQGGLVAKTFLERRRSEERQWSGKIITVGTPFYGAAETLHSIYYGHGDLNDTQKPDKMPRTVGTWPAAYALMFLPMEVYAEIKSHVGEYPIADYKGGKALDPFDSKSFDRYPSWARQKLVNAAKSEVVEVSRRPPDDVLPRWFNVYCTGIKTPVKYRWERINGEEYDPIPGEGDQSPLTDWKYGQGDGTVASWSAVHAGTPAANRIKLSTSFPHARLLESAEVQLRINAITGV